MFRLSASWPDRCGFARSTARMSDREIAASGFDAAALQRLDAALPAVDEDRGLIDDEPGISECFSGFHHALPRSHDVFQDEAALAFAKIPSISFAVPYSFFSFRRSTIGMLRCREMAVAKGSAV